MLHWRMAPRFRFRDIWRVITRAEKWLMVGAIVAWVLMWVSIFNGSFEGAVLASLVNATLMIILIWSLKGW